MSTTRPQRRRDYFRGDVVERLNLLRRQGIIVDYQLSTRERGELDVSEIAVRVPDNADSASALTIVKASLSELEHFEELGGKIVLDRSTMHPPGPSAVRRRAAPR